MRSGDAHYCIAVAHLLGQYCTAMGRFLGELRWGKLSGAIVPGSLPGSSDLKIGTHRRNLTGV
jgi:hypothetical protein